MHPEQIEAIVQGYFERNLGDLQTLAQLHQVLIKSNVSSLRPGESDSLPLNAGLFQSLFLSHLRLAQMMSDFINAHQGLHQRIDLLEKSVLALQEAVINLQQRLNTLEGSP